MYGIVSLLDEKHYVLIEDLWAERVLQVRERIMLETNGHIFEDSTELIRQQREERTRQLMGE